MTFLATSIPTADRFAPCCPIIFLSSCMYVPGQTCTSLSTAVKRVRFGLQYYNHRWLKATHTVITINHHFSIQSHCELHVNGTTGAHIIIGLYRTKDFCPSNWCMVKRFQENENRDYYIVGHGLFTYSQVWFWFSCRISMTFTRGWCRYANNAKCSHKRVSNLLSSPWNLMVEYSCSFT